MKRPRCEGCGRTDLLMPEPTGEEVRMCMRCMPAQCRFCRAEAPNDVCASACPESHDMKENLLMNDLSALPNPMFPTMACVECGTTTEELRRGDDGSARCFGCAAPPETLEPRPLTHMPAAGERGPATGNPIWEMARLDCRNCGKQTFVKNDAELRLFGPNATSVGCAFCGGTVRLAASFHLEPLWEMPW